MSKTKRINFQAGQIVNGIDIQAMDLDYRDGFVRLTPVNERSKQIESRTLFVPAADLEELIDSLLTLAQDEQIIPETPSLYTLEKEAKHGN